MSISINSSISIFSKSDTKKCDISSYDQMKTEKVNNANNFPLAKSVNKIQIINETETSLAALCTGQLLLHPYDRSDCMIIKNARFGNSTYNWYQQNNRLSK